MFDVISIGNISIDIFFQSSSFTFKDERFQLAVGGKYFAEKVKETVGGGGANVAIGIAQHNLRSAVYGKIGNNSFKSIIIKKLEDSKVNTKHCQFVDNFMNISSILLTSNGERTIIHYTTPYTKLFISSEEKKKLLNTKLLYIGNTPVDSWNERKELISYEVKNKVLVALNIGIDDCRRNKAELKELLQLVDILLINGHEFSELAKVQYKDIRFAENIIEWYLPYMKDKLVIVTEGSKGSYAYKMGSIYHHKADKVHEVLDTTGAGDAYTAGFLSSFIKNENIEKSMYRGSIYAAQILRKIGAN